MIRGIVIRADANTRIGTGHAMRCLALAQTFQRKGQAVVFAMAESTPAVESRIRAEGFELTHLDVVPGSLADAGKTIDCAQAHNASYVVADGYGFDFAFQDHLVNADQALVLLDDYGHAGGYCADFVLNQNLGASIDCYPRREPKTRLLLGTRYCLLRNEFLKWREWRRTIPARANNVLVSLGGSDPDNVTGKVVEALRSVPGVKAVVVVGGSNPHLSSLRASLSDSDASIKLVVNSPDMPKLMAEADIAVTAGGSTVWEAAFMGLPALTIVLATNQKRVAEQLHNQGATRNLGWCKELTTDEMARMIKILIDDSATRFEMSNRGRKLVDGLGSLRVWLNLNEDALTLRLAVMSDDRVLWELANQVETRRNSFSSEPIAWDDHVSWFRHKLADATYQIWIAEDEEKNVAGQVRFEQRGSEAIISVALQSVFFGRGLGTLLIWKACRRLLHETPVEVIHAYIRPENSASIHAFENAGFRGEDIAFQDGCTARHLVITKNQAEL